MRSMLRWIKTHSFWLLIAFAVMLLNLCIFFNSFAYLSYFTYLLCGIMVIYLLFFNKKNLYLIIAFLIPLSIPIKLGGGSVLSFPSEALAGIFGLFVILKLLIKTNIERRLVYHPLTIILLLELLWMLICSFYSSIPEFSFKRTLVRAIYLSVFFFMSMELFKDKRNMWFIFLVYGLGVLYPVIHSMIAHAKIGFDSRGSYQMTLPFFADHTIYGGVLAFLVPIITSIAFNRTLFGIQQKYRTILWIFAIFLIVATILSYSRAAWIGLIIALFFSVLILFRTRFYVIIIGLTVITAMVALNLKDIGDWAKHSDAKSNSTDFKEHVESVSNIQNDASNTERINRWKCAYRMYLDRPVVGFGPGTYQYNYGKYQVRAEMTHISTFTGNRGHAHSEYMTYLSEEGLPGLLLFIVLVFYSIFIGLRIIYKSQDVFLRRIALAALLSLITFYIHGIFNAFLDLDKMAMLVFASLALLVSIDRSANYKTIMLSENQNDKQIMSNKINQ